MKNILKKISILFACLAVCVGFSVPLFLNQEKATGVSAEDFSYGDVVKYGVGNENNPLPFGVYGFNFATSGGPSSSISFSVVYFEQGDFILSADSGRTISVTFSSLAYSLTYQYGPSVNKTISISGLGYASPFCLVPYSSSNALDIGVRNFIINNSNPDYAHPILKNTFDYYSQLLSEINSLESQITILESSIANNSTLIASYQATISQLNSQNENLHNQVVSIQSEYDTLEAQYEALEISYEDLLSSEASLLTFINGFIHSTLNSEYTASTLTQGVAYLNTRILSNQEEIESLNSQISQLDAQIEADDIIINQLYDNIEELEAQVESLYATSSVFGLIRSAFSGIVPLLDLELMPNITIGMILTIPFVLAVLGFILKALG